jgi:uncharacterized protein YifE (UPF0438 family)
MKILQKIGNFFNRVINVRNASPQDYNPKNVRIKKVGRATLTSGGGGDTFEPPEWDFNQIDDAYSTSSYTRQAIDKYIELMFKESYDFVGPTPDTIEYIRKRFKMMAIATGKPVKQFFTEMAEDLVKYSNVFIVKARQKNSKGLQMQGKSLTGVTGNQPIAGYFLLSPTTVSILRDEHGTIKKYEQEVPGNGDPIEFKPEDVIHIYYKKDRGKAFGQPFILPVLDDIRALREAEESVLRLLYRHLFPLYQYKVGIAEPGFEADDKEIENVRQQIENMPADGGIVTPERHDIKVIGADGEAIDAKDYLEHFEKRVFTGLGVSSTVMGRGDTANRSTADNMTKEMHDRIKAFQEVMSTFVNEFVIQEMLLEAGYDPIENPDDAVEFQFREIDTELKIKKENHAVYKYEHNAITEDEMRKELGLDPIQDRALMHVNLVGGANQDGDSEGSSAETDNKNKPENQSGSRDAPKTKEMAEAMTSSAFTKELDYKVHEEKLLKYYDNAKKDILDLTEKFFEDEKKKYPNNTQNIKATLKSLSRTSLSASEDKFNTAFHSGVIEAMGDLKAKSLPDISYQTASMKLERTHDKYFNKLADELADLISEAIKENEKDRAKSKVKNLLNAHEYRIRFIAFTELMHSFNYGYALTAKELGEKEITVKHEEDACDLCAEKTAIDLTVDNLYEAVPPFHTKCSCTLYK